jgi:hypothetical protein
MSYVLPLANLGKMVMRKIVLAAVAAFVIGGATTGALIAAAQPAPPPADVAGGPPPGGRPPHPMMGWMHWRHAHRWFNPNTFALVYRAPDRNLTPADVQKVAEAFLLFRGNHTWKVTNVALTADGDVGFSLTTPEGSVIAKFTMNPHTGRVARVG